MATNLVCQECGDPVEDRQLDVENNHIRCEQCGAVIVYHPPTPKNGTHQWVAPFGCFFFRRGCGGF